MDVQATKMLWSLYQGILMRKIEPSGGVAGCGAA